jgi:hypothetical protein
MNYMTKEAREIMDNDEILGKLNQRQLRMEASMWGITEKQEKRLMKEWSKRIKELGITFEK